MNVCVCIVCVCVCMYECLCMYSVCVCVCVCGAWLNGSSLGASMVTTFCVPTEVLKYNNVYVYVCVSICLQAKCLRCLT